MLTRSFPFLCDDVVWWVAKSFWVCLPSCPDCLPHSLGNMSLMLSREEVFESFHVLLGTKFSTQVTD